MVDVELEVMLPWEETRSYEYSKLYVATPESDFSEECVVCFRLEQRAGVQRTRLRLPGEVLGAGRVKLRLDPFPFCGSGRFRVLSVRLVGSRDEAATRQAELVDLKQSVRRAVENSERIRASECLHLPESLSIELTPRCNLTCGHCSSHGTGELHRKHNQMSGLDPDVLRRLADEVFPSLTGVTLVGRGEPLLVDDATWEVLVQALRRYGVLLRFVTNGTLLRRRLTPEVMSLLDTVTVSIDGNSEETMRANRGGVHLAQVLANVRHYHDLRRAAGLARRPRLGISWTLKRNNIHELPAFIERIAELEPDLFYARHLLVFFERDRAESLVGDPELTNRYLRPAYELLAKLGIRSDCPPLMAAPPKTGAVEPPSPEGGSTGSTSAPRERGRCPFVHRTAVINSTGAVPTCSVPFAAGAGMLGPGTTFSEIWNGPVLVNVRAAMDTPREFLQCRACWYREGHYAGQRAAAANDERFDLETAATFTEKAWDFRAQKKWVGHDDRA